MDKQNIIKRKHEGKVVPINIRITKRMSEWLKEKDYSPTGIFNESCKELGFK